MSLSSVSQSAADIYNASKGYLGYFGYTNWKKIGNNAVDIVTSSGPVRYTSFKEDLIGLVSGGTNGMRDQIEKYYKNIFRLDDTQAASLSSQVYSIPKEWFDVYVAVKPSTDSGAAASKSYEKNIASSFAGKYFWSYARPKKYRTCTKSLSYDVSYEYTPSVTDVYSPATTSLARHITTVNANAPWYQLIGPRYGMQSFLWPQQVVVDVFGQPTRSIWTHTPIKVMEREAKFGNVVQWDVYNNRDGTVVKKGSPMSELCRDTCGIDLFDQFKPMVSKWKHGQPGMGSTSVGGGVGAAMDAVRIHLENNPNSATATACGQDVFSGQQVEVFVIPIPFMIAKFMNVVPVEDIYGNFNLMGNPEEETYIQNIKQNQEPCQKLCDDQKNYIKDEICDCDQEIFSGPGDLSAQTIDFQNALFSPQPADEPHAHGLYNNTTFGATLSFRRDNPWINGWYHGALAFDTFLNIALPTATFRIDVGKYSPSPIDSQQIPTDGSFNASQWIRANFKEKITISYTLPKDTSVINTFNSSLPGNVAVGRAIFKKVSKASAP